MLKVANLGGRGFQDLSFDLRPGEILGFAGAEGNGQRDAIRALGGLKKQQRRYQLRQRPRDELQPG